MANRIITTIQEWDSIPPLRRSHWDLPTCSYVGTLCTGRVLVAILRRKRALELGMLHDISALVGGPAVAAARRADLPSDWRATLTVGTLVLTQDGHLCVLGGDYPGWKRPLSDAEESTLPNGYAHGVGRGWGDHEWA